MGHDPNVIRFEHASVPAAAGPVDREDADLLEYARVLWQHRRWLVGGVLGVMIVTAVVNLLLAPTYLATSRLLPATGGSGPAIPPALLQMAGVAGFGGSLQGKNPTDRFVAILKSETVAAAVIESEGLMPLFFAKEWDADAKAWRHPADAPDIRAGLRLMHEQVLTVDTSVEGVVEVSAEWTDPAVAARIANAAAAELERFLREKDLTLAARHREFIEERRIASRTELAVAEDKLRGFSEKHGLVSVGEQTRALFSAIGQLHAQIATGESRIDAMRQFRGENDPDLLQQVLEVQSLKNRLIELEHGAPPDPGLQVQANGLVPMYKLPEVGLEYARLLRDVTVQGEVFTLLSGELERAKIEERREEVAVQVLDEAREPDRKHRPQRTQNTLLAGVVAAFLGVLAAFALEGVQKLRARAAATVGLAAAGPVGDPATT
jgi:tyrosine-protein kinase Etk/Wzc